MKLDLTLANLRELDFGKLEAAFRRHLERITGDCVDRPGDPNARKIAMTFEVRPEADPSTGACERCKLQVHVASFVPPHKTRVFDCMPQRRGNAQGLMFNDEADENAAQGTFGELVRDEAQRQPDSD